MWVVTLTLAQANAVRGKISETEALDPQQLADGTWFLPARCLIAVVRRRPALAAAFIARARRNAMAIDFISGADAQSLADAEALESLMFTGLNAGTPAEKAQNDLRPF